MKKTIFCCLFLLLIQAGQAEDFKGKFMLSVKAGPIYLHQEYITMPTLLGSRIDYFVGDWISVGLEMDYMEYNDDEPGTFLQYYGAESELGPKWRWYSFAFSGKLLLNTTRFSPFLKIGLGFYIPQEIYHWYTSQDMLITVTTVKVYGKTCPGYNMGMGFQYRVWKGFGLQLEGTIDHIINRARQISSAHSFTFANVNAGLSIIF